MQDHKPILAEKFKTRLCHHFIRREPCPYEARCMFAHGVNELRTTAANWRDGLTNEASIARFVTRQLVAYCFGSQSNSAASLPFISTDGGSCRPLLAERFKTKPCASFAQHGSCRYGTQCMFAHGAADLRTTGMNYADGLVSEDTVRAFQLRARDAPPVDAASTAGASTSKVFDASLQFCVSTDRVSCIETLTDAGAPAITPSTNYADASEASPSSRTNIASLPVARVPAVVAADCWRQRVRHEPYLTGCPMVTVASPSPRAGSLQPSTASQCRCALCHAMHTPPDARDARRYRGAKNRAAASQAGVRTNRFRHVEHVVLFA